MSKYSERWFNLFPSWWSDPTTLRGLFGSLLTFVAHGLIFILLFALVRPANPVEFDPNNGWIFVFEFLLLTGASAGIGGGWVVLVHKNERVHQLMLTFSGRLGVMIAVFGTYWLLLLYNGPLGLWAAAVYLVAKGVAMLGIFIAARL